MYGLGCDCVSSDAVLDAESFNGTEGCVLNFTSPGAAQCPVLLQGTSRNCPVAISPLLFTSSSLALFLCGHCNFGYATGHF